MIKMSTNPLPTNKSLNALEICCQETALLSLDTQQHSLHLRSLVEHYLQPPSFPSTSSPSPLFHSLFNHHHHHHHPHLVDHHKSFIHELQTIMHNVGAEYVELRREVTRATKKAEIRMHSQGPPCSYDEHLKVVVLRHLRRMGFNAAICTSKRDPLKNNQHKGHFPAEEYEYMDVILEKGNNTHEDHAKERVIIDLRFRSQFEIARPSIAYVELLKVVPIVYVGSPHVLQKLLRLLSDAIRKSLESQDFSLPPWRRLTFFNSKWLSPNYFRSNFAPTHTHPNLAIKKSSSFISTKRDNALSPISTKKENALSSTNTSSSSLISKRENSLAIINNVPITVNKPSYFVDGKHVLQSTLTTHILPSNNIIVKNGSKKQLTKVSVNPIKEPWQLPPLSNPAPTYVQNPRKLVGALTKALQCESNSTMMSGSLCNLQFSLSTNFS